MLPQMPTMAQRRQMTGSVGSWDVVGLAPCRVSYEHAGERYFERPASFKTLEIALEI